MEYDLNLDEVDDDIEESEIQKEQICRDIAELLEALAAKFMQLGGVDDYGRE